MLAATSSCKLLCCIMLPCARLENLESETRQHLIYLILLNPYPPTPAFAKAGAAPGTTAGVELVFVGLLLPCLLPGAQATALCC